MTETTTYQLSAEVLAETRVKLAKLNERAAKRGLAGHVELVATEVRETGINSAGFEVTEVYYEVEIVGQAPKFNGWSFIATLDWDASGGLVTRTVPGYEGTIDRSSLVEGKCDHCKIDRQRNLTYLLRNESGQTVQVGSTCIKDFLGTPVRPAFIYEDDATGLFSESFCGGRYGEFEVTPETALAIAWAAIQVYGFVRSGDTGWDVPTRARLTSVLYPASMGKAREDDLALARKLRPLADQAKGQAQLIKDYILSDDFSGDSEYVTNLKVVIAGDRVSIRNFGLLASAPQAWARAVEKDLRRKADQANRVNEYIGSEGDKIELTANVKSIRYIDGSYGTTTLYTLVTDTGHLVKWFSSSATLGHEVTTRTFTLQATIKKHDEYEGTKATVITRAKVLSLGRLAV